MRKLLFILTILASLVSACSGEKDKSDKLASNNTEIKKKQKLFKLIKPEESGIQFRNDLKEETEYRFFKFEYLFNGAGVGMIDVNNDGLMDIYMAGNEVPGKLYLNKGDLKFEDITEKAGVAAADRWTNGVSIADVNADGLSDIYLSCGGENDAEGRANVLLINNGDLSFTDKSEEYGINDKGYSTQSSFIDIDLDGDLDLYVLNHHNEWVNESQLKKEGATRPIQSDKLYRNDNGKFVEVSKQAGLNYEKYGGWGLGIATGDMNGDGYPDIYISNDYDSPDYMYVNQGDGTFKDELKDRTNHISLYSMGNDMADFNNDGLIDIYTLDMAAEDNERIKTQMSAMDPAKFYQLVNFGLPHQYMYNSLHMNNGNGSFSDIGQMAGVHSTDWSWAPLLVDMDNDGWKDLFVSNGYRLDDRDNDYMIKNSKKYGELMDDPLYAAEKRFKEAPKTPLPNYAYKNNGDLTFSKKSYEWGLGDKGFSQGAATADLDNDGDLDFVINNINEFAWLYENKANEKFDNEYLKVSVEAEGENKFGIGSKISLYTDKGMQYFELYPVRGYMSSLEPVAHFGLPEGAKIEKLEVVFPGGKMAVVRDIKANTLVKVKESEASQNYKRYEPEQTYMAEATDLIKPGFKHEENEYDDFAREILLPHRNSQHGPGMAVGDANGDGLDDFYVGGAYLQAGRLYIQRKDGSFQMSKSQPWKYDKNYEDMGALFFDFDNDKDMDLYVVSGGNEFPEGSESLKDRLYINDGNGNFKPSTGVLPDIKQSGKVIKAADYDKDGDLDLFLGGRLVPGKYPFSPKSYILRNDDSKFVDVTEEVAPFLREAGLVTAADWVDYNNDGSLDLMLVGEWTSINLLENKNGKFEILENDLLANQIGWWSSLHSSDIDGDGDTDFLVGNLGLNYKYKASFDEPFHIYCHDFDNSGSLDIVLGYYNDGTCYPVRGRTCSSQQMPFIKKKFSTYKDFSRATVKDIYGDKLDKALHYAATNFASIYIRNDGEGKFTISKLPIEVQLSSINGIVKSDLNGDGNDEIAIAGNLFEAEVETPRNDALVGRILKFNDGSFEAISVPEAGFYVPGDVKTLELITLASGEKGILVANNNDQLQLFKANMKVRS